MTNALILHHSRTGITAAFAEKIAAELSENGIEVKIMPMYQADSAPVENFDTIFIGCWTSGLMFFLQKPEKLWIQYIKRLPDLKNKKIVLFTTYKILTGTMFAEMLRHLPKDAEVSPIRLKSRSGKLSASIEEQLQQLI